MFEYVVRVDHAIQNESENTIVNIIEMTQYSFRLTRDCTTSIFIHFNWVVCQWTQINELKSRDSLFNKIYDDMESTENYAHCTFNMMYILGSNNRTNWEKETRRKLIIIICVVCGQGICRITYKCYHWHWEWVSELSEMHVRTLVCLLSNWKISWYWFQYTQHVIWIK